MAQSEIQLQLLLGKQVIDIDGKIVGSIEEICAEKQQDEWVVKEYLIGGMAIFERLSAWQIGLDILRIFGAHKIRGGYHVPWDKLDLSDPIHPKLLCKAEQLKEINPEKQQASV